jgi:hypothetical protein
VHFLANPSFPAQPQGGQAAAPTEIGVVLSRTMSGDMSVVGGS